MTIVKCPNPSCPFQFDATLVPPGAVIACPQCRLQFQLPQAAAAPPPPAEPAAEPKPERRRDRDTDDPPARGRRRRTDDTQRDDRPKGKGNTTVLIVAMVVGMVFLCCGGGAAVLWVFVGSGNKPSNTSPYTYPDYNLKYQGPGEGWQEDKETQGDLKFRLAAFKSPSPEGYIAVQVVKTEGEAGKGDLLPAALGVLKDKFDDLDEEIRPEAATLLGSPAEKYEFTGVYRKTTAGCRGEVYAVAVRNLKVWVYFWTARDHFDTLAPAFEKFRGNMTLETKGNEPKVTRQKKEYRTSSGLYVLTDSEGNWQQQKDPTRQDAAADLWLTGARRNATTGLLEPNPDANLVVAVLDKKGDDAKAQAKAHVLDQFAAGAETNEQAGDPAGDTPSSGPVAGSDAVVRFKMTYPGSDRSIEKMMVFRVTDTGGKRVVAYAWCQLRDAGYWEQRLMLLTGTLKGLK